MITFTRSSPGTYDQSTDTYSTPSSTTITGEAIQVAGDPVRYRELMLVLAEAPTLYFVPTDYGLRSFTTEFVQPGDSVDWNNDTFTVKDVKALAPDGVVIAARIIVAK